MIYHILNGDALKNQLPNINGEAIVMRECLMDGPVDAPDLDSFFIEREKYICSIFETSPEEYLHKSKIEIQKLLNIKSGSEVNLWFEDDLFCQSNMWFCCHILLKLKEINVYLVRPDHQDWAGFGIMNEVRLSGALDKKSLLNSTLLTSFSKLWESFQHRDNKMLIEYGAQCKSIIPRIKQVVQAHIQRSKPLQGLARPEKTIHDILNDGKTTFPELFKEFSKREGIYGFGDLQIKRMYDNINE